MIQHPDGGSIEITEAPQITIRHNFLTVDELWRVGIDIEPMSIPQTAYYMHISDSFRIEVRTRPNAWFRFWQRVLLGWKWEPIKKPA